MWSLHEFTQFTHHLQIMFLQFHGFPHLSADNWTKSLPQTSPHPSRGGVLPPRVAPGIWVGLKVGDTGIPHKITIEHEEHDFFLAQNAGVHYSQIKLYEKPIVAQGKLSTQGGFSISVFVYWRIAQGPGRFLGFTKKTQMEQLRWFNTRSGPPVMFVGLWTNDALVISP